MQNRLAIVLTALAGAAIAVACKSGDLTDIPTADQSGTQPIDATAHPSHKDGGLPDEGTSDAEEGYKDRNPDPLPAEGDCAAAPKLPNPGPQFYCPHATPNKCGPDSTCCNPDKGPDGKYGASFCADTPVAEKGADKTQSAACAAQAKEKGGSDWVSTKYATSWECIDQTSCGESKSCCLYTSGFAQSGKTVNFGPYTADDVPSSCKALQSYQEGGSRCADKCDGGSEIKLCTDDSQCGSKAKCIPFKQHLGPSMGFCKLTTTKK